MSALELEPLGAVWTGKEFCEGHFMRRVVVTGLGLVTPLADGVEESWSRILDGQSGAGPITGI